MRLGVSIGIDAIKGVAKPNGNPSACALTVIDDTTLQVDWTNGATNQDGTYVYVSTDNVTFTLGTTALGSLTTKNLTGLTAGTLYYVKVAHYKGTKLSEYSNIDSATTYAPFYSDLLTYYKDLSSNAIIETLNGINAKILPSYASFNGTDDLATKTIADYNIAKSSGYVKIKAIFTGATQYFFTSSDVSGTTKYIAFLVLNTGQIRMIFIDNSISLNNQIATTDTFANGYHEIEYISTGSAYQFKVDGVSKNVTVVAGSNNGYWFDKVSVRDNIAVGGLKRSTTAFTASKILEIDVDGLNKWVFCEGEKSGYIYDVIGSNYLTWQGTGSHYAYDENASLHGLQNGVDIYEYNGDLIRIPYTASKVAITTPVTTNFVIQSQNPYYLNRINRPCCLIDFDPLDGTSVKIDNFDRSNETIFNAAARSASDYDATNPYRVHVDNLTNLTDTWKNTDYKDMVFFSVTTDVHGNIIYIKEILNYATKKI